jgi:hypothetical protein
MTGEPNSPENADTATMASKSQPKTGEYIVPPLSLDDLRTVYMDRLFEIEEKRISLQDKELDNSRLFLENEKERYQALVTLDHRELDIKEKKIQAEISDKKIWIRFSIIFISLLLGAFIYALAFGDAAQRGYILSLLEGIVFIMSGVGVKAIWDSSRRTQDFDS